MTAKKEQGPISYRRQYGAPYGHVATLGGLSGPPAPTKRDALRGLLEDAAAALSRLDTAPILIRVPGEPRTILMLYACPGGVSAAYCRPRIDGGPCCARGGITDYSTWTEALRRTGRHLAQLAWAAGEPWESFIAPGDVEGLESTRRWVAWQERYKAAREGGADERRAREIADAA